MKYYWSLVLFCSVVLAQAQLKSLNYGSTLESSYLSFIKFEMMGDKIIVPVTINGEKYRFLLDTGAPNIISKELDSLLRPKSIGSLPTSDATGKKNRLEVVAVKALKFGEVNFTNTATLVYDLRASPIFNCFNIDGFIGSNMLRNSIIQIDVKARTLILTNSKKNLSLNRKQSSKITLTKNQSSPMLWVQLKGEETGKEQLLIDTGADDVYDLSKDHYKIFKTKSIFKELGEAEGASSVSLFGDAPVNTHSLLLLPELKINGFKITDVVTQTMNDDGSRIGAGILHYGRITIDYKGKRFYFDPYADPDPPLQYHFGFANTYLNNKLSIGFVWDPKLRDLISYGDEVLAINGIEINYTKLCALIGDEIKPRAQKTMTLKLKNASGEINEYTFEGWVYSNQQE